MTDPSQPVNPSLEEGDDEVPQEAEQSEAPDIIVAALYVKHINTRELGDNKVEVDVGAVIVNPKETLSGCEVTCSIRLRFVGALENLPNLNIGDVLDLTI